MYMSILVCVEFETPDRQFQEICTSKCKKNLQLTTLTHQQQYDKCIYVTQAVRNGDVPLTYQKKIKNCTMKQYNKNCARVH